MIVQHPDIQADRFFDGDDLSDDLAEYGACIQPGNPAGECDIGYDAEDFRAICRIVRKHMPGAVIRQRVRS